MSECFSEAQGAVPLGSGSPTYSVAGIALSDALPSIQYSYEACGDVNLF